MVFIIAVTSVDSPMLPASLALVLLEYFDDQSSCGGLRNFEAHNLLELPSCDRVVYAEQRSHAGDRGLVIRVADNRLAPSDCESGPFV